MARKFSEEVEKFAVDQFLTEQFSVAQICNIIQSKFNVIVSDDNIFLWLKKHIDPIELKTMKRRISKNVGSKRVGENGATARNSNLKICYLRYFMDNSSNHAIRNPLTNQLYTKEEMRIFLDGCGTRNLDKILANDTYPNINYFSLDILPDQFKYDGVKWSE